MSQPAPALDSLYNRLGGEAAVTAAVDIFYNKVVNDPLLAPMFDGVDMTRQRRKQVMFLTVAFGGPALYSGEGMRAAHKRLVEEKGLDDEHFDAVVSHLADTLSELGVPDHLIAEVGAVAETVRDDVLGR